MFTVKFPFRVASDGEVGGDAAAMVSGDLQLALAANGSWCVLSATGFRTEEDGAAFLPRAWAGLRWVLLQQDICTSSSLQPQPLAEGPFFAVIDEHRPAVYRTGTPLQSVAGGEVRIVVSTPRSSVLATIAEGASFARSDQLVSDARLRVAMDLYGAYFTETSGNAKFLTLIMALESMAVGVRRPLKVVQVLESWKRHVEEILTDSSLTAGERASFESLKQDVLFRTQDSIGQQVSGLVRTTLHDAGDVDADRLAKRARDLYGLRSKLVHTGVLPPEALGAAMADAKMLVQRVLTIKYLAAVS